MFIATDRVSPDEECHGYFTGPVRGRMVEWVFVVRGDAIAKYEQDFGSADQFGYVPPMKIPSFGENTVAELQWHGERHRHDEHWGKYIAELKGQSTLFADVLRQEEQKQLAVRNKSVFGPAQTTQRNGHNQSEVWRRFKQERDERRGWSQY
jgi:hypothetical protein